MNLTELFTWNKIRDGDIGEFERLFLKYYEPLCHHACRIMNDMDASEDLVQDIFYRLWKNREKIRMRISVNAYLYRSVRNNALREMEQLALRRDYTGSLAALSEGQSPAGWDVEAGTDELGEIVEATLSRMPVRCARIFRMNRYEGKKYREIAEVLGISVKTVEADMGKALQMFRLALGDYSGSTGEKPGRREDPGSALSAEGRPSGLNEKGFSVRNPGRKNEKPWKE